MILFSFLSISFSPSPVRSAIFHNSHIPLPPFWGYKNTMLKYQYDPYQLLKTRVAKGRTKKEEELQNKTASTVATC
jgi:hypothetical protein